MYRVEDKYVIPLQDYYELHERLRAVLSSDHNSESDQGYSISSLYFDDICDTDYWETVSGNPFRMKHRIRIYNDSLKTIKLEVKRKNYNRISKISCSITTDEMRQLMKGRQIVWGKSRDDPRSVFNEKLAAAVLRPKVIVTYEREAFIYEPGNVRITFDKNIRGSDHIELFGNPKLEYDYPKDLNYVLEIKYDEFIPDFLLQILEIDSMQQTSYSKYRKCREIYMNGRQ